MTRTIISLNLIILGVLLPFIVLGQVLNPVWEYYDIATTREESGANPDFFIHSDGSIHISYWNKSVDQLVYMNRVPGQGWTKVKVDSTTQNGYRSSIHPDLLGNPAIAYYQNNLGERDLKFATKTGPLSFSTETLPAPANGWGPYNELNSFGAYLSLRSRPDFQYDPSGYPFVIDFGSWANLDTVETFNCLELIDEYDWSLWGNSMKTGSWETKFFPNIQDEYYWCNFSPLPWGDRFGEFASIHVDNDGNKYITTHAFYNSHLLLFKTDSNETNYQIIKIDSAESVVPTIGVNREAFTFDGISSHLSDDGSLHLAYGTTVDYGSGILPQLSHYNSLKYARLGPDDSLYHYSFPIGVSPDNPTTGYTSIKAVNSDEIYFTYGDRDENKYIFKQSADSGNSWITDTLFSSNIGTPAQVELYNDSVFVLIYDGAKDELWLFHKSMDDSTFNWIKEKITYTEDFGKIVDSRTIKVFSDTLTYLAYADQRNNVLLFSEGKASEGWEFVPETVDSFYEGVENIKIRTLQDYSPVIAYSGVDGHLSVARKSGASWVVNQLDPLGKTISLDFEVGPEDSMHICFYDFSNHHLIYALRSTSSSLWQFDTLASFNSIFSRANYINLELDNAGMAHISYFDKGKGSLEYIYYDPKNKNIGFFETLKEDSLILEGKNNFMDLDQDGRPHIVFTNNQSGHFSYIYSLPTGDWEEIEIDEMAGDELGNPARIEIDKKGKPWILYNYKSGYEKMNLVSMDSSGWFSVSIPQTGKIAKSFSFQILNESFVIVGRKNDFNNKGVAMLFSNPAISLDKTNLISSSPFKLFPNPNKGSFTIEFPLENDNSPSFSVYDSRGRMIPIRKEQNNSVKTDITLENAPAGIYFLKIQTDTKTATQKFIIH